MKKIANNLGLDPVPGLVLRLAIPSMIAQFVNVLYSVVDRIFIGHIPDIGDIALAGVGVTGPIVTLIGSVAFWVGIGGAPLMSIRMGEKNEKAAEQVLANAFLLILGMGAILTVCALLFKSKMLWWFGASEATFPYANAYMSIYVLGTIFSLIAVGMNQFIICQGFAKQGMFSVLIGAVANIVLDPIFIFGFHMGVPGAAIATVLSQMLSASYVLYFLFGKQIFIRITFGGYLLRIMGKILLVGFAPFLIIASDSILIITMNSVLQHYGGAERGDMLVTCATIVQSFMLLVTMPMGGITGGTQAILGYNYGARQPKRIREAEKYILLICVIFTGIMFLAANTVSGYFALLFTENPVYAEFSAKFIKIFTLGIIPLAFQYTIVDGFTGMGIVQIAISLSFMRKFLYFIGMFVFPALWGAEAIFYAEPVTDVISGIITTTVYVCLIGRILRKRGEVNEVIV